MEGYPQIGDQLCEERLYLDLCGATSDDDDLTGRCGSLMYSIGIGLSKRRCSRRSAASIKADGDHSRLLAVDSTDRCNNLVESFSWCFEVWSLSRALVQPSGDGVELCLRVA